MAWYLTGAITLTCADLLSIGPLGTNFNDILNKKQNCWLSKMHLKISSAKGRPFCPTGDELIQRHQAHTCQVPAFMSPLLHMTMQMASSICTLVFVTWPTAMQHRCKHAECHHIKGRPCQIRPRNCSISSESIHYTQWTLFIINQFLCENF